MESTSSIFVGRRQARIVHWVMAGFFLCFLIPTFGFFVLFIHNPAGILVGGLGSVLWTTMMGLCLQNVFAAASKYRVEPDGLAIDTPRGTRTVKWSQVARVTEGGTSTSTLRLKLKGGGSVPLRLELIEDGQELGRIVRAHIDQYTAPAIDEDRTYRSANLPIGLFALSIGSLLYIGGGLAMAFSHVQKTKGNGYLMLVLGTIWTCVVATAVTGSVSIVGAELIFGNPFKKTKVRLADIERVEADPKTGRSIQIYANGKSWQLPPSLQDQDDLMRRLQQAVQGDESPEVPKQTTIQPADLTETLEFRPKSSFYVQAILMAGFFLAMTAMGPITIAQDGRKRVLALGIACIALFGSMLAGTIYMALVGWARYIVDATSIERKSIFKPWRIQFADVESAWRRGQNLNGYRMVAHGNPVEIDLSILKDADALVSAIESRLSAKRAPIGPRKFGVGATPLVLVGIGAFFMVIPFAVHDLTLTILCEFTGWLLALAGYAFWRKGYETTRDGIWVINWTKRRFLPFSELKRLEIDTVVVKSGVMRRMTLEHPEGGVIISSQVEDFAILEAYLKEHLDPSKVHDATLSKQYVKAKPTQ